MIFVLEVAVFLSLGKVKERAEISRLMLIDGEERFDAVLRLGEQSLLNDLSNVGAGELHAIGETSLDFGESVALFR